MRATSTRAVKHSNSWIAQARLPYSRSRRQKAAWVFTKTTSKRLSTRNLWRPSTGWRRTSGRFWVRTATIAAHVPVIGWTLNPTSSSRSRTTRATKSECAAISENGNDCGRQPHATSILKDAAAGGNVAHHGHSFFHHRAFAGAGTARGVAGVGLP